MSSIFLSYHREDFDRAKPVALALQKAGHTVWWDRHIAGGAQFSKEIEQALKQAEAVVVLWSERSIESAWVRDEAAAGRDRNCLVPVTIDGVTPPLGFRQYQTVDLSVRKGRSQSEALKALLRAIDAGAGVAATAQPPQLPTTSAFAPRISAHALLIPVAIVLVAALSLVGWQRWQGKTETPLVAVAAIDSSGSSRALARDLLIKLGSLQAAKTDLLRLAEASSADRADLVLEAGAGAGGGQTEANLALLAGSDRTLLWSKQFVQPQGREAELRQQLAVTAGRALDCALQALTDKRTKLSPQLLKLYLNGCAGFDELAYTELRQMIPVMRQVTRQAPKFHGGWGKLIMAELLTGIAATGEPNLLPLRQHIAEARRFHPHLAEAYLAEVELLPEDALGERLRLIEIAIRHNPDHPEPPAARAYYLRFVGRMTEGVESAKRGADLNPLSPALRRDYIAALVAAGQIARAKQELERAEQLWPDSSVVADARAQFKLGHGDQRGSSLWTPRFVETFLKAQSAPTPPNIEAAIGEAQALTRQEPRAIGVLVETLGAFDREEALFPLLLDRPRTEFQGSILEVLFRPSMREFWHDPRFMIVAKRLRLLDYWRTSGKWPDFCFEPDLPYDCKKEAAKLS